jgi:hypothetical protein
MRVKISEFTGPNAMTLEQGDKVFEVIEPVIAKGEPVELDFEGVTHVMPPFLNAAIGRLIPIAQPDQLDTLLRATNLVPLDQELFRSVIEGSRRVKGSQESVEAWQKRMASTLEEE